MLHQHEMLEVPIEKGKALLSWKHQEQVQIYKKTSLILLYTKIKRKLKSLPWSAANEARTVCSATILSVGSCVLISATNGEEVRVNPDNNNRENYSKSMEDMSFSSHEMRNVL